VAGQAASHAVGRVWMFIHVPKTNVSVSVDPSQFVALIHYFIACVSRGFE
jgi:hypothetical protein